MDKEQWLDPSAKPMKIAQKKKDLSEADIDEAVDYELKYHKDPDDAAEEALKNLDSDPKYYKNRKDK